MIGVVGKDEVFTILEGDDVAPWIAGLGAASPAGAIAEGKEMADGGGDEGGAGGEAGAPSPPHGGGGAGADVMAE